MDLYSIALFLHIVGALLVFVLLTIEGLALRFGFPYAQLNRILGPVAALLVLVPGLYMMKVQWGWTGWVVTGLVAYVLIATIGAYTGIRLMRGRMDAGAAIVSWLVRTGVAVAVVFDMSVKPNVVASVLAVLIGAALGGVGGMVAARRQAVQA
ncbi:MAG TPA: hypothetical protein VFR33_09015 [Candidatus Dormibacteraeota bacterium]|nr:hypothetical protein [Candidatus Dormibacteraeota bacterium]